MDIKKMSNFILRLVFICQNRKKRYENGANSAVKILHTPIKKCKTAIFVPSCTPTKLHTPEEKKNEKYFYFSQLIYTYLGKEILLFFKTFLVGFLLLLQHILFLSPFP